MKRIALALAAATLGTGCIVTTDNTTASCDPLVDRTLTISWSFTDETGVARTCATMQGNGFGAIQYVDVYIDTSNTPTRSPCTDYTVTWDNTQNTLPSGTHTITVEGIDGAGNIVARDWFNVNVANCGNTSAQAVATQGVMDVQYTIAGGQCTGGYMWFSVTDTIANAPVLYADASYNSTAYVCGVTPLTFVMPIGTYSLDWIQDVTASGTSLNQYCTATPFSVSPQATQAVPVALSATPTGATCP